MNVISKKQQPASRMVTFYHDIEQDMGVGANKEECRQIVKEFLDLEKKYGVPTTYNVVGKLFQEQPDLSEWILRAGQEVAFHSFNHQSDCRPEYYSDEIDLCRNVSSLPLGYRSPKSRWNQTTLKTLWEKGFLWNAETDIRKEPYFIYKGLVRLPIAGDDWPLQDGTQTVNEWVQQFSRLLEIRPYFGFGAHDCVTSFAPEERLKAWERVLQIAVENDVLLVSFSEATDLFRRAALSNYYSNAARDWNADTKTLYRTKRFSEMIRDEAEKLNEAVVADLGSGGGVLSAQLKDIAKSVYCVDNAPGMVDDVDTGSCVTAVLSEVTDSSLPDDSVDLVICARIIEYLFWPDRLADEIKRIARTGATYFITFPAWHGNYPLKGDTTPDRIRRYFTPDDIEEWAKQIGLGRLIGVQYERPEPTTPEMEKRYREMEDNPPLYAYPTNWVYIGTVKEKSASKRYRRNILVTAFTFNFSSKRYDRFINILAKVGKRFPKRIRRLGFRILYR